MATPSIDVNNQLSINTPITAQYKSHRPGAMLIGVLLRRLKKLLQLKQLGRDISDVLNRRR